MTTSDIICHLSNFSAIDIVTPSSQQYMDYLLTSLQEKTDEISQEGLLQIALVTPKLQKSKKLKPVLIKIVQTKVKETDLNANELIVMLYFIAAIKSLPVELMARVETLLVEHIQNYSSEEISLVCHAFFTSNSRIKHFELLNAIADKVSLSAVEMKPYMIANVMKVLRHAGYVNSSFYEKLVPILVTHKLPFEQSLVNLCHVCESYCSARFFSEELLAGIEKQLLQIIQSGRAVREKDVSRILWCFSSFNYKPDSDIIEFTINQWLTNTRQVYQYPEIFVESLVSLAVLGHYSTKLLEFLWSPKFIKMKQGK